MHKNMATRQRIIDYDLARVVSILAVVVIHCFAFIVAGNFSPYSETWMLANILDSCSRWAVPVFIMLSGALLIKPGFSIDSIREFYWSKVLRVVGPLLVWSVIYLIWYAVFISANSWTVDIYRGVREFLAGNPIGGHLYFIQIIIGLYAITPFLSIVTGKLNRRSMAHCAIGVLLMVVVSNLVSMAITHDSGRNMVSIFIPYIGYYLLGYVLGLYREELKQKMKGWQLTAGFMGLSAMIAVGTYYLTLAKGDYDGRLYGYLSPLVVIVSIIVFIGLMKLSDFIARHRVFEKLMNVEYVSAITQLSGMVFGVYFVHRILIDIFWMFFDQFKTNTNKLLVGIVTFIVVVIVSFLLSYIYKTIRSHFNFKTAQ